MIVEVDFKLASAKCEKKVFYAKVYCT